MPFPFRRALGAAALVFAVGGCAGGPVAYDSAGNPVPGSTPPGYPAPIVQASAPAGGAVQIAYGTQCFAGFYQCPLGRSVPVGSSCSCPGLGGPSFGTVR